MDGGYVSRVVVSPWGFGRAIYINHPSGLTTVYGHLKSFAPFIDEIVRRLQYEQEDFAIDCEFAEGEIPVGQGDLIGYSGNAGSSGGPHLHLDIRDTATEDPMDPQEWLSQYITDDVAPEPRRVVVYTHDGVLGNTARRVERKATRSGAGSYSIGTPVPVWGDVSFGIEAYDRMTGTANKYGVHQSTCMSTTASSSRPISTATRSTRPAISTASPRTARLCALMWRPATGCAPSTSRSTTTAFYTSMRSGSIAVATSSPTTTGIARS